MPGLMPVIDGPCVTVNVPGTVRVPPGVVTTTEPVVAPAGTMARISVFDTRVTSGDATPPNVTLMLPMRLVPVIVTCVPGGPVCGLIEVTVGAGALTTRR